MSEKHLIPAAELLDESIQLTLGDLASRCKVEAGIVIEMVEEGVLEPAGRHKEEWLFHGHDLMRLHRALRLQEDLGVNLPGIALAIDLLEELDVLRSRLKFLERRFTE